MSKPEGVGQAGESWFRPSAERNKEAILSVLNHLLPPEGLILEIASGTGQHIVHFAAAYPALSWQPTEPDPGLRDSIVRRLDLANLPNIRQPLELDVMAPRWPIEQASMAICINMVHIAPWDATEALFAGCAGVLATGQRLVIYGPFLWENGTNTDGNLQFDRELRKMNTHWGVRTVAAMEKSGTDSGFALSETIAMPSNNLTLVFQRGPD